MVSAIRLQRRLNGDCELCGRPAKKTSYLCKACCAQHTTWNNELRDRRREAGLCPICGEDPEPGFIRCKPCRVKCGKHRGGKEKRKNE